MNISVPLRKAPVSGAISVIAALFEQRTGQTIGANRVWRIEMALQPVLRELDLTSVDEFVSIMLAEKSNGLRDRVVDSLLNQETSFFRDSAVLEMVGGAAYDMLENERKRRLRIWSAGCSTGQEALSIAMLLSERTLPSSVPFPEIWATDVSPKALERARAGSFNQFEIQRGLPIRRMMNWFDGVGGEWVAKRDLVQRIHFRQHNLAVDEPPPGRFDIILCRNVLLYFSPAVRRHIFDMLAQAVRPGGLLVLGAGETVAGQTAHFEPCDTYRGLYRACTPPAQDFRVGVVD